MQHIDEMEEMFDYDLLEAKDDYIQNLEYENKNMADFLESLGFTQEQITSIALTGCPNEVFRLRKL